MAERKFRKIDTGDFVVLGKEEEGKPTITAVEGTLTQKEQIMVRGTLVGKYAFTRDDNSAFGLLGAKLLDEAMMQVNIGDYVRISLDKGTTRTASGNEMKNFTVEVAE